MVGAVLILLFPVLFLIGWIIAVLRSRESSDSDSSPEPTDNLAILVVLFLGLFTAAIAVGLLKELR